MYGLLTPAASPRGGSAGGGRLGSGGAAFCLISCDGDSLVSAGGFSGSSLKYINMNIIMAKSHSMFA